MVANCLFHKEQSITGKRRPQEKELVKPRFAFSLFPLSNNKCYVPCVRPRCFCRRNQSVATYGKQYFLNFHYFLRVLVVDYCQHRGVKVFDEEIVCNFWVSRGISAVLRSYIKNERFLHGKLMGKSFMIAAGLPCHTFVSCLAKKGFAQLSEGKVIPDKTWTTNLDNQKALKLQMCCIDVTFNLRPNILSEGSGEG